MLSSPRGPWRLVCAVVGLTLAVSGLLTAGIVFRLLVLLTVTHDFGMYPIELWGAPLCFAGIVLCLLGAEQGAGLWLARIGLGVGIIGLLTAGCVGIALLTFTGGNV